MENMNDSTALDQKSPRPAPLVGVPLTHTSKPHSCTDGNATGGTRGGWQTKKRRCEHAAEILRVDQVQQVCRTSKQFETEEIGVTGHRRGSAASKSLLGSMLADTQAPCQGEIEIL